MLYYRRKLILALFETFGNVLSSRRIQKILFLITRGAKDTKSFDFVPFKYGSFSFQIAQDLTTLTTYGYLNKTTVNNHTAYQYIGNKSVVDDLNLFDKQKLIEVKHQWSDKSDDELFHFVYTNYPFYGINSEIAQDLLSVNEYSKLAQQKERLIKNVTQLYTLGYEGLNLESYITKLILKDIKVLCDVRKNAFSQKFGFSKKTLQIACEGVGIKYIHIPQLGIDSDKRQDLNTQSDYNRLFDEYEQTTLMQNDEYLDIILEHIRIDKRVVLMCFEKDPLTCHRSRIAKSILNKEIKLPFENLK